MSWPSYAIARPSLKGVSLSLRTLPELGPRRWAVLYKRYGIESELRIRPPGHRSLLRIFEFLLKQDLAQVGLKEAWPVMPLSTVANYLADHEQSMRAFVALIIGYTHSEGDYFTGYRKRILRYKADILAAKQAIAEVADVGEGVYQEVEGRLPEGVSEVLD